MKEKLLLITLLAFLCLQSSFAPPINSTEALIEAMHKKYKGKAAKNVTFTQYNTHYEADTVKNKTIWYEAIAYPNNFRIDFGELKEGNAVIFAKDSVYNFKNGQNIRKGAFKNNLILLAGGLNFMDKDKVLEELKNAGYDVNKFREDSYDGREVYVVGADKGDFATAQFWIDKNKLYLVRTFEKMPNGDVREARFSKHTKSGKGWIETEVLFLINGKKTQLEEYKNLKSNVDLDLRVFDATYFGKVHWMEKSK
ncbi:MAG: hypothetical protein MUE81_05750 [Thermoflexibacter sp.]|jgi:hypothetical protein|nr:hypothetical protein [Thermoflexibacter sp.]